MNRGRGNQRNSFGGDTPNTACRKCGEEGHWGNECPNSTNNCYKCGKEGHFSRECPEGGADKCFGCGEEGHQKRDCPNKPKMKCYNCGEEGHGSRECPKNIGSSGGNRGTVNLLNFELSAYYTRSILYIMLHRFDILQ